MNPQPTITALYGIVFFSLTLLLRNSCAHESDMPDPEHVEYHHQQWQQHLQLHENQDLLGRATDMMEENQRRMKSMQNQIKRLNDDIRIETLRRKDFDSCATIVYIITIAIIAIIAIYLRARPFRRKYGSGSRTNPHSNDPDDQ